MQKFVGDPIQGNKVIDLFFGAGIWSQDDTAAPSSITIEKSVPDLYSQLRTNAIVAIIFPTQWASVKRQPVVQSELLV